MILYIFNRHEVHPRRYLVYFQILSGCDFFYVLLKHEVVNHSPSTLVVRRLQTNQFTAYCVIALLLHETDYLR